MKLAKARAMTDSGEDRRTAACVRRRLGGRPGRRPHSQRSARTNRLPLTIGLALACSLWLIPAPTRAIVETGSVLSEGWRRIESVGGRSSKPRVLAQAENGDIAVGDLAGVSWWRDAVRERAVLRFVRDLAFDSQGDLWIATLDGLYLWRRADRPERRRLRDGDASNRIHRIAVSRSALLIATGSGAYWSSDGRIFQPLRVFGATTAVSQVAIRAASFDRPAGDELRPHLGRAQAWVFGAGRLALVRGLEAASGMRVTDVQNLPLPRPGNGDLPVDLVIDSSGRRLFLVYEDVIAWRSIEDTSPAAASSGWQIERPGLPPGAVIRRLGWAAGRVWLATDHGLLEAETLKGPFRRAASPVGTTACVDIQPSQRDRVLALCRTGLFVLNRFPEDEPHRLMRSHPVLPPDPPLEEIRRRALVRAGLTASRAHGMWDRLRRRAFWPEIGLRFEVDYDFDDERDKDQAFLSGDTRYLFDRKRDEDRHYGAVIEFDWDLGGVVYPLESVDLSRELRQVVSLRDDVADEINQLYFERQTIREKLSSLAPTDEPIGASEATRLFWRARELDAGLDAWTGGWISRWRSSLRPDFEGPDFHSQHPEQTKQRKIQR